MATIRQQLERRIRRVDGVVESESAFRPEPAFWVNGKEIAHFEGPDAIEVRLTKAVIRGLRPQLKADPRVELRPSGADWITVRVATKQDADFVVDLVERAADAHRPPPGRTAKFPPTGADLARRRRFH